MTTFLLRELPGQSRLILCIYPGHSAPEHREQPAGEIIEETYGTGLGWYAVKRVRLDREALKALKLALPAEGIPAGIPPSSSPSKDRGPRLLWDRESA